MSDPANSPPTVAAAALSWHRAGKGAALAFVLETWGSAPRPVGAMMAVSADAQMAGSVSGGCIEGEVVHEALEAIEEGRARVLDYGVSDADAIGLGLACGGRIRILVEPVAEGALRAGLLAEMVAAQSRREPVAYSVTPGLGDGVLLRPERLAPDDPALQLFARDRSAMVDGRFVAVINPPLRLAVVGAVHTAQALVAMAGAAGFDVSVIDPREAFASPERFPGVSLVHDWPDEALAGFGLDGRVAVVTLTHDPKLDDPAIIETLRSDAFYLGCLGSTRTHAKRLDRLRKAGVDDADLARIHAPVGLDIGSVTPGEIAISILAEIVAVLRGNH